MDSSRIARIAIALAVSIVAALAGWQLWDAFWPRAVDDDLVRAFAADVDRLGAAYPSVPGTPEVVGRVVAIEAYQPENERYGAADARAGEPRWRLSRVQSYLPDDLAAEAPADVGTVARVDCAEEVVGQYVLAQRVQSNAHQFFCRVSLVDLAARRVFHVQHFAGEPPPRENRSSVDRYGTAPVEEIADWLAALPRR